MNNNVKKFLSIFLLLYLNAFSFAYPPLGKEEFETIAKISTDISQECPKASCLVIGLGRSPTAIIAFLQANTETLAINVPLSGIKGTGPSEDIKANKEILFPHFDKFIDAQKLLNAQKLILLDYTITGKGFLGGAFYLKTHIEEDQVKLYIAENKKTPVIEAKAITSRKNQRVVENLFEDEDKNIAIQSIILDPRNEFFISLSAQGYDDVSEFGSFYLFQKSIVKEVNPKYTDLKDLMKKMPQLIAESTEELLAEFNNDNPEIRNAAAKLFVEKSDFQNPQDITRLKGIIFESDKHRPLLLSSVMKLLEIIHGKDKKIIQLDVDILKWLVSHINNDNSLIRQSLIKALKVIKPDNQEIITSLIAAIENENQDIRNSVVEALAAIEIKNLKLLKILTTKIKNPNEEIRKSVINSLKKLKLSESPNIVQALSDVILVEVFWGNEEPAVKSSAIDAFAALHTKDLDIQDFLVGLLDEDDSSVQTSAKNALIIIGPEDPKILEPLAVNLKSPKADVRAAVAEILEHISPVGVNRNIFENIILSIATSLHREGERESTLISFLKTLERAIRSDFLAINPEIYQHIITMLKSDNKVIQAAAKKALMEIKYTKVPQKDYLKILLPLLEDPNESIKDSAISLFLWFDKLFNFEDRKIDQEILDKIEEIAKNTDVKGLNNKLMH